VGLELCPLILVSTIEELLERKSGGFGLEIREYGRKNSSRWQRGTLYPQKLAPTSPTSGGRSVGILRSLAKATEFSFFFLVHKCPELKSILRQLNWTSPIANGTIPSGGNSEFCTRFRLVLCVWLITGPAQHKAYKLIMQSSLFYCFLYVWMFSSAPFSQVFPICPSLALWHRFTTM
jgi:hypothetical protein